MLFFCHSMKQNVCDFLIFCFCRMNFRLHRNSVCQFIENPFALASKSPFYRLCKVFTLYFRRAICDQPADLLQQDFIICLHDSFQQHLAAFCRKLIHLFQQFSCNHINSTAVLLLVQRSQQQIQQSTLLLCIQRHFLATAVCHHKQRLRINARFCKKACCPLFHLLQQVRPCLCISAGQCLISQPLQLIHFVVCSLFIQIKFDAVTIEHTALGTAEAYLFMSISSRGVAYIFAQTGRKSTCYAVTDITNYRHLIYLRAFRFQTKYAFVRQCQTSRPQQLSIPFIGQRIFFSDIIQHRHIRCKVKLYLRKHRIARLMSQ